MAVAEAACPQPRRRRLRGGVAEYERKYRHYASVSQKSNAAKLHGPKTRVGIIGRNLLFAALKLCSPSMKAFDSPARNITLENYAEPIAA